MSENAVAERGSVKQMMLVGPEVFALRTENLEKPQPGWSRIRVTYTGICGSDFPIVAGKHPRAVLPLVMGHEITGVVVESDGELEPGTRVAVNPLLDCGVCGACRAGHIHLCRRLRLLGIDAPGSLAETMDAPTANLFPFADGVDPTSAAWAEPLAVAVHAVRRSRLEAGSSILVFGGGPIGLLVALVAKHHGAENITIVEPSEERRVTTERLGFTAIPPSAVVPARDRADAGPEIVYDCAGHPSVVPLLTETAPVRGRIVIVAVHHGSAPVDLREVAFAEQEITGVRVYERTDFATAVGLIDTQALPLSEIPVAVYPLDQIAQAVAEARSGAGAVKVLVAS